MPHAKSQVVDDAPAIENQLGAKVVFLDVIVERGVVPAGIEKRLPPQRELRGQTATFGEDDFARVVPAE